MVFKDRNLMFVTCKNAAMSVVLFIVFLIACSCSTARDVKPVTQLAISPDGTEFVFRYQPANGNSLLVRFNRATGDLQPLPQPADKRWFNPAFSADGKWLGVASYPVGPDGQEQSLNSTIDVMRRDGTERRTVVGPDGLTKVRFTFSPDGKKLLFSEGSRGRIRTVNLNIREVDLETLTVSDIAMANFYGVTSLSYLNDRFAYVGYSPHSYLEGKWQAPDKYQPEASDEDKKKWEMLNNSMLFVTGPRPSKLDPYVRFDTVGSRPLPWQQVKEIEGLRVAVQTNRMFVAMRHTDYPQDRSLRHYIRDIYEMYPDKTFRRLTHFNTVQIHGFDVTPDGRYVAVVPDNGDEPERSAACIYLIDLSTGKMTTYEPNFSKLQQRH